MAFGFDDALALGSLAVDAAGLFGGGSSSTPDYTPMKKRIRWTVKDAQAAGIHPLYALGAPAVAGMVSKTDPQPDGSALAASLRAMRKEEVDSEEKRQASELHQATVNKLNMQAEEARARAQSEDYALAMSKQSAIMKTAQAVNAQPVVAGLGGPNSEAPVPLRSPNLPDHSPNPKYTDQELIERQYGGVVGEVYGFGRYLGEMGERFGSYLHKGQRAHQERMRRERAEYCKKYPQARFCYETKGKF